VASRYIDRIVQHLSHQGYQPAKVEDVASDMHVDPGDRASFDEAVAVLEEQKRIVVAKDGRLRLPPIGDHVTGVLRLNRRGFGFIIPDEVSREGDLFIPPDGISDAISGDRVRAEVFFRETRRGSSRDRKTYGRIVEVLERGHTRFTGVLVKDGRTWMVQPDGNRLHDAVVIRDAEARSPRAGLKVVFELLHHPEGDYLAEGVITEVLGDAGRPDVETAAVITAHGLATAFPEAVLDEARAAALAFDGESSGPWPDREDLTETYVFTIDPPDARDFDDAISIDFDEATGHWTLGVHIADVSHFVPEGAPLDIEARERGNSTYLPRHVIPMLPETLSNGVCSLQEGVPRFVKSAIMELDGKGKPIGHRLASSIIKSNKRLTYLEAQALIDGDRAEAARNARAEPKYDETLIRKLKQADTLARIIQKRRRKDGMIVLDLPETELIFDDEGHVIDAVPEDDAYTHKLIEMFMVEANEAVARTFSDLMVPLLRRIHPAPVHGDVEELAVYARIAQHRLPENPTRLDICGLLESTRGTPVARAVHFGILRTLTKAEYSPNLVGHYALASEHYAHFTSPIRRYPDLTVHRVIQAFLDATDNGRNLPGGRKRDALGRRLRDDGRVIGEADLLTLGRHCSATERESEAAERELREFLVMQFLQANHIGDEIGGVVTGVTPRGVFVSLERFLVEGMIEQGELPGPAGGSSGGTGRWLLSETTGRLVAKKSGQSIGIGDVVKVRILDVDAAGRHMELAVTEMPDAPTVAPELRPSKKQKPYTRGKGQSKGKSKGKSRGKGRH
jgi:ribonuclease R